jgi:signal transduction histidine kinase
MSPPWTLDTGHWTLGEVEVAESAGRHGAELLRQGYTLSHVVHAYGAMCQAITEVAGARGAKITPNEFHDLNQCLDVAIAGAVTEFQALQNSQTTSREIEHIGFLAHELRNALSSVNIALELIQGGTVGYGGNVGRVMASGLKRLETLINRSLTEVRLRVDPKVYAEKIRLLHIVDQMLVTAEVEARARNQSIELDISADLEFEADRQLIHSALTNLVQNALKYSPPGARIQIRGRSAGEEIVIEVEDQCGGLGANAKDLFAAHVQKHDDRQGMGLGLTIAQRSISLLGGRIQPTDLPGRGCIFTITVPKQLEA